MAEAATWLISTQSYDLTRRLGPEAAQREFLRQCQDPKRGDLPAAGVVHSLLQIVPTAAGIFQSSSTTLPKLRSRAAHAALLSGAALWIMVDDDVETDVATLVRLVTLAGGIPGSSGAEPRISVLPYRVRGTQAERERVHLVCSSTLIHVVDTVQCRQVERAGCGLMMVSRGALALLAREYSDLRWADDDGVAKLALFHMHLGADGAWLNEDYSFCLRARQAGIPIYAPVEGMSIHDGAQLNLAQLR